MTTVTELGCLETAYVALLRLPFGSVRMNNQKLLGECRDALVIATGKTQQQVQEFYEEVAFATLRKNPL